MTPAKKPPLSLRPEEHRLFKKIVKFTRSEGFSPKLGRQIMMELDRIGFLATARKKDVEKLIAEYNFFKKQGYSREEIYALLKRTETLRPFIKVGSKYAQRERIRLLRDFNKRLHDKNEDIRADAIMQLALRKYPRGIPLIANSFKDLSPKVRLTAANELVDMAKDYSLGLVIKEYFDTYLNLSDVIKNEKDENVRSEMANLWQMIYG